jgi:hypothetical protein
MITIGYCTIPEALTLLEEHGRSFAHLEVALLNGELRVFVEVAREYDWEICRVPREDLQALHDEGWAEWLARGRVPPAPSRLLPDPDYDAAYKAYLENFSLPRPERKYRPYGILDTYEHKRFLISERELDRWLGRMESRTGAPGRPSSMDIVLREAERRKETGKRAASKQAEAEALAIWLRETHPEAPPLTAKTIRNRLAASVKATAQN